MLLQETYIAHLQLLLKPTGQTVGQALLEVVSDLQQGKTADFEILIFMDLCFK